MVDDDDMIVVGFGSVMVDSDNVMTPRSCSNVWMTLRTVSSSFVSILTIPFVESARPVVQYDSVMRKVCNRMTKKVTIFNTNGDTIVGVGGDDRTGTMGALDEILAAPWIRIVDIIASIPSCTCSKIMAMVCCRNINGITLLLVSLWQRERNRCLMDMI